jgi:hypothetical protein
MSRSYSQFSVVPVNPAISVSITMRSSWGDWARRIDTRYEGARLVIFDPGDFPAALSNESQ